MLLETTPPRRNMLIERLPVAYRRRFVAACEPVELEMGDKLTEEGRPTKYAYFPFDGITSQLSPGGGRPVEVSLVGKEGMIGSSLALGVLDAMLTTVIQREGNGLRIPARRFMAEADANADLRRLIGLFALYQGRMMARTAFCNRFHQVESRLARWLLMIADRASSLHFRTTHQFLAIMLGTRRAGVTMAAAELHSRGLIRYSRGRVEIVDRKGVESIACECYRFSTRAYDDIFRK